MQIKGDHRQAPYVLMDHLPVILQQVHFTKDKTHKHTQLRCADPVTKCPPQLTDKISRRRLQYFPWFALIIHFKGIITCTQTLYPAHQIIGESVCGVFTAAVLQQKKKKKNHLTRTCNLTVGGREGGGTAEGIKQGTDRGVVFHLIHFHSCITHFPFPHHHVDDP